MGLYSSWLLINNGILICYGQYEQHTSGGSSLSSVTIYPISYSNHVSSVVVTTNRDTNKWDYDFWYSYAVFKASKTEFHIQLHGLNNGQYITGFTWISIGF